LGNKFTVDTYKYAKKPIYPISISATFVYPRPERKNFEACRKSFLWFGSHGFVHKGLDLVLEAFAEMPEYRLTVCGPFGRGVEQEFEKFFHKELYDTPNIRTVGWVDVASMDFLNIAESCVGLIYPSCSEGQSGGVVTCMHAGLIPMVSRASGIDMGDFGFLLQDCSVATIREDVSNLSRLTAEDLRSRGRRTWEFARAHHTRKSFSDGYRAFVRTILATYGERPDRGGMAGNDESNHTDCHSGATQESERWLCTSETNHA
jgi:glycosyltransferase involved in cell wall biosynthesis